MTDLPHDDPRHGDRTGSTAGAAVLVKACEEVLG